MSREVVDAEALRWSAARVVAVVASVVALAISIYLTVEHYDQHLTLACPENGTINCAKVTTSRWSVIAGVPVAVLGLAYFVVMSAVLAVPIRHRAVELARVVLAVGGALMVVWLVYVELFEVDAICLWCLAVHVLTVVMLAAVLWRAAELPS
ncbi:MAG: vitamin K epoxide reductase family protein [Jatrophihabitans sp.]|uniref:vitamin K epoxide reductase family protein n=1 Tax=Jatrophihabitans sp. TaxID=1932789 RepID=UPI003F7EAA25